jgi:heme-degrading monooxygenase HmoA
MFARNLSVQLKPNTDTTQYAKLFHTEALPLLRKQPGFRDEITLSHDDKFVNAISLWDSKEAADAYETSTYPQVLKIMEKVTEGAPKIRTSKVVHSSYHAPIVNATAAKPASANAPETSKVAV